MKVLILNQFFYPDISATSQLMTDLAEDLTDFGAEVTAVCCRTTYNKGGDLPAEEVYKGIRIVRARSTKFNRESFVKRAVSYLSFYVFSFFRMIRLARPDVIIVLTTPPLIAAVACAIKTFTGCKVIYLVQDLYPDVAIRLGVLKEKSLLTRLLGRVSTGTLTRSDAIIALGDCMRKKIESKARVSEKIHVIPNWADGTQIVLTERATNPILKELSLQNKFVVYYSGNMGKAHEFDTILQVASDLSDCRDIAFVFVGEGPKRDIIARFIRDNPGSNVILLPYRSRDELSVSLGAADVSLVSLADSMEGLVVPSKVYGVMAAGRPVVFIGPGGSEAAKAIAEAECGYVLENGDASGLKNALLQLKDNVELARHMGTNSRMSFERNFNRRLITRRYFDLIKQVVEKRSGALPSNSYVAG